jgi:uncharacterized membrane protein YgdD (TMEM256/DUF423 family)
MHKTFLAIAAALGGLAVILGAFGAHALKKMVADTAVTIFETGVRYHFYHVFALALAAILFRDFPGKWMHWAGVLFIVGILLFSGSLYALTYVKAIDRPGLNWIGIITPFGGLAFIGGWLCMLIGIYKNSGV